MVLSHVEKASDCAMQNARVSIDDSDAAAQVCICCSKLDIGPEKSPRDAETLPAVLEFQGAR